MIYYVEDDINIRNLTVYALQQAGFEAEGFSSADDFRTACNHTIPSLVLLDIMLPDTDGLELLAEIRRNPRMETVPVLLLSAKGTEPDKVLGLDAGADDYLAKPFGMAELVSRCHALLRRASRSSVDHGENLVCGPIVLNEHIHEAFVSGVPLGLTPREFDLLHKLISEQDNAVSREQLLEEVWNSRLKGETRTVDMHIQTLRKKLSLVSPGSENLIQTIRGVGYRIKDNA